MAGSPEFYGDPGFKRVTKTINKGWFALLVSISPFCYADSSPESNTTFIPGFYGDPRYEIVRKNIDFQKGYYLDVTGKFVPLNGMDPVHLGNGGGSPPVYYKTEEEDDKS